MTWTPYQQLGYIEGIRPSDKRRRSQDEVLMEAKARAAERHKIRQQERSIETARQTAKLKNAKWTHEDLAKLMYHQEKILSDHRSGEPREFEDDKTQIDALLAKRKGEIKLEGVEKEPIPSEGVDYLYGLLIQDHILKQGFYVEIDKDHQPVVLCNDKKREAQREGLQKVLQKFEFQHDVNNPLRKNDNISKVAVYMTAAVYHGQKEKNLINYRQKLEEDLKKDPNKPITADEVKNSNLTPQQKSFLLMWKDRKYDANLMNIQEGQEKYVRLARENYKNKTLQQTVADVVRDPVRALPMLLAGGFVAACLYGAFRLFKKGGFFATLGAIFLGAIGGTMAVTAGSKLWRSAGVGDYVADRIEGKPVDREQAKDNPYHRGVEKIGKFGEEIKDKVGRLHDRVFAGPDTWTPILMKPDIGNKLTNYPAGALLYTLYSKSPTEQEEFKAYKDNPLEGEIQETLKKLDSSEREQLIALMRNAWDRQKQFSAAGVLNDSNLTNDDADKLTLGKMIQKIDDRDRWWNELPDWVGLGNGFLGLGLKQNTMKTEALKIMAGAKENKDDPKGIASNMEKWGKITIGELRNYFNPFDDRKIIPPNTQTGIGKTILELYGSNGKNKETIKEYLKTILPQDPTAKDPNTLFRDILSAK